MFYSSIISSKLIILIQNISYLKCLRIGLVVYTGVNTSVSGGGCRFKSYQDRKKWCVGSVGLEFLTVTQEIAGSSPVHTAYSAVVQWLEYLVVSQEVAGSSPVSTAKKLENLK